MDGPITRLFPASEEELPLEGLYLRHALHQRSAKHGGPVVYANYVSSLDGRIAVVECNSAGSSVPGTIANPRDWRLYQELAAQADVLITSARYIRQLVTGSAQGELPLGSEPAYADLHAWRQEQGLAPQPAVVILSSGNDLPLEKVYARLARPVYVAVGAAHEDRMRQSVERIGATLLIAGPGNWVEGKALLERLTAQGFRSIYCIAGPKVLKTLITGRVLDRLYLTQVLRLIGGADFDTLLEADIGGPFDMKLLEMYHDPWAVEGIGQVMGVYGVKR